MRSFSYALMLFILCSVPLSASLPLYERPNDEKVFSESDIVAIVQTVKGQRIPLSDGGGIKVTVEIIHALKGGWPGDQLKVYYGAGEIGRKYIATLVWDEELGGYKYFDPNMDHEVFSIDSTLLQGVSPQDISNRIGFEGEVIGIDDGEYYLPSCKPCKTEGCQAVFDQLQVLMEKLNEDDSAGR